MFINTKGEAALTMAGTTPSDLLTEEGKELCYTKRETLPGHRATDERSQKSHRWKTAGQKGRRRRQGSVDQTIAAEHKVVGGENHGSGSHVPPGPGVV